MVYYRFNVPDYRNCAGYYRYSVRVCRNGVRFHLCGAGFQRYDVMNYRNDVNEYYFCAGYRYNVFLPSRYESLLCIDIEVYTSRACEQGENIVRLNLIRFVPHAGK